ncbi:MAG: C40 family peptidase [Thiobacillus sp.]
MKSVRLALACLFLISPLAHASEVADTTEIPMLAVSLVGSPYRFGGASPETGFDCSGLVNYVFGQAAGLRLPRESLAISQMAHTIEPQHLQSGDLVFFNTLDRAFSHVGIYLGDDRFVHASSSRSGQVMVSNMATDYWRSRFDGARRLPVSSPIESGE